MEKVLRKCAMAFLFFTMAHCAIANEPAAISLLTSDESPIVDDLGRHLYIIDLADNAQDLYSRTASQADIAQFGVRHSPQAINMVKWYEQQYQFNHVYMTSWVGNSFSAYLTQEQVRALRLDPQVVLVTEDSYIASSVIGPPWYDSTHSSSLPPFTETSSWGRERGQR